MKRRVDVGTVAGLAAALLGILGGYTLEHGRVGDMLGVSAALIVIGGSLGATLVGHPMGLVRRAFGRSLDLLLAPEDGREELIEMVVGIAGRARKNGLVSLEQEALQIEDRFLSKSLTLAVDGMDLQEIREVMDLEIELRERRVEEEAKVWEAAGGFAPTIGIIGAVLGLIVVMRDLGNMQKVGDGIAAAFVATIYGVGSANLLFLPAAAKLKLRGAAAREKQELMLEGVCGIVEGMNPKLIRVKLEAYLGAEERGKAKGTERAPAAEAAATESPVG
ncbi:MAG: flagellar motor protein [Candidatus Solibacter usitatus]|nr:flagellar motor protein [Candidatus Solibacter usitatus]